ncbi:MAG TPA: hypothetical protein VFE34_04665 [Dongiaceae bacterium]|jgi:hypothetical protein|nr:hypothetical protein [Dongiaceae bacterium]
MYSMLRDQVPHLLPREHTSLARSIKIAIVAGAVALFGNAFASALPEVLQGLGWQGAPDSIALAWFQLLLQLTTTLPYLMCMASASIAFARRRGLLDTTQLALSLVLMRNYLSGFVRRDRG